MTNYYTEKVRELPFGLTRAIGRILERAIGHDQAIPVDRLVKIITHDRLFEGVEERQVRAAIEELRQDGIDIINLMDGAGYFIPGKAEKELYIRFRQSYTSRAKRIFETIGAMDRTAARKFGSLEENPEQMNLL